MVEYVLTFTSEYNVLQSLSKTTLLISMVLLFFDSFISIKKKKTPYTGVCPMVRGTVKKISQLALCNRSAYNKDRQ